MNLRLNSIFFLASFREKALRFYCGNFLSKCCVLLVFIFVHSGINSQNVIKVKKEEKVKNEKLIGFYYSDLHTTSSGSPGNPPTDYRRIFMYVDPNEQVYLFHSNKSVKKVYKLFLSNPQKFTQEQGKIEITPENWLYINVRTAIGPLVTFKYVGEFINSKSFYIDYKAAEYSKVSLKIYLYQYSK